MTQVGMHEAKTNLSKLVERAEAGEDIVIARNGEPVARLVPVPQAPSRKSIYGIWRDKVWMADDFDELEAVMAHELGHALDHRFLEWRGEPRERFADDLGDLLLKHRPETTTEAASLVTMATDRAIE